MVMLQLRFQEKEVWQINEGELPYEDETMRAHAKEMKPGCCVNIPSGVKHWHGAASDSWFSHLAIEVPGKEASNEWLEAVTDEQYKILK